MKKIALLVIVISQVLNTYAQHLNVATFNIRHLNKNDEGNLWDDRKNAVTDLIKYHEFDIFGTQEGLNQQIQDIQNNLPEYKYVGVGRNDGKDKGEYAAIFYKDDRFKLIKEGNFWLTEKDVNTPNKGWDAAAIRICTWAIFKDKKKGKKFLLMNTHFDHIGKIARVESAKLILQKAEEIANGLPLIIMGDFNINQKNEAYFSLANSKIVKDTYALATLKYEPNSSYNGWGKSIKKTDRIDHIFVSKDFNVKKYGILTDTYMGKFPSDHFPVVTQLSW